MVSCLKALRVKWPGASLRKARSWEQVAATLLLALRAPSQLITPATCAYRLFSLRELHCSDVYPVNPGCLCNQILFGAKRP